MPKISVISGLYNCAQTLDEAINSILKQTETDWEWIMCDDGSSDETYRIAQEHCDAHPERIVLLKNERNMGLNYTLNRCLQHARGTYIARMDGDDLCEPDRFAKELAALESEPDMDIVSTGMTFFDEGGVWGRIDHPAYPQKKDFVHGSPFCHAPCMVRKRAYDAVGGYSEGRLLMRVEDYHLWYKMYKAGFRGRNLPEALYGMRDDRNAYARRKFRYRINEAYVMLLAVRDFRLPLWQSAYAFRPILVGLLPGWLYDRLHRQRLDRQK